MLSEHRAAFRDVYRARFEAIAHSSWRRRFEELVEQPDSYRFLAGAQLLKHYLGLKHNFGDTPHLTLAYVWWEPWNAAELPIFAEHREEVTRFARGIDDPHLTFHPEAYPDLWTSWASQREPTWVREHVDRLRRRYLIRV